MWSHFVLDFLSYFRGSNGIENVVLLPFIERTGIEFVTHCFYLLACSVFGGGCGTAVERVPHDPKVVGLKSAFFTVSSSGEYFISFSREYVTTFDEQSQHKNKPMAVLPNLLFLLIRVKLASPQAARLSIDPLLGKSVLLHLHEGPD